MRGINDDLVPTELQQDYEPEIPDRMHADVDAYMEWAEQTYNTRILEGIEDGD